MRRRHGLDDRDGTAGSLRALATRGPLLVIAVLLVAALLAWIGNNWDPGQFVHNLRGLLPADPPAAERSSRSEDASAQASGDRDAIARAIEADVAAPADPVALQSLEGSEPQAGPPASPGASGSPRQPRQPATQPGALRGLLADAVDSRRAAEPVQQREIDAVPPRSEPAPTATDLTAPPPTPIAVEPPRPAAPAGPAPPARAARIPPDVLQAGRLLDAFSSHYADGDLRGLTRLFSPTANAGTGGVPALRSEYAALFRASRRRSLLVTGVQWRPRGATLVGEGRFLARLMRRDGSEGVATGSIQLVVEHGPGGPRIAELHHREGR